MFKFHTVGDSNMNCSLADYVSSVNHLNDSVAQSSVRGKYAVFNRTKGRISHLPAYFSRDFGCGTGRAYTDSIDSYFRTGSDIIVLGSH